MDTLIPLDLLASFRACKVSSTSEAPLLLCIGLRETLCASLIDLAYGSSLKASGFGQIRSIRAHQVNPLQSVRKNKKTKSVSTKNLLQTCFLIRAFALGRAFWITGLAGLEPTTYGLGNRRSIRLSYSPRGLITQVIRLCPRGMMSPESRRGGCGRSLRGSAEESPGSPMARLAG